MIKPTQKSAQKKQGSIQPVKATETRSLQRDLQLQKQDHVWTVLHAVLRIRTLTKKMKTGFTFQKFIWNVCMQGQVQIHRWTAMYKSDAHITDYLKTTWNKNNKKGIFLGNKVLYCYESLPYIWFLRRYASTKKRYNKARVKISLQFLHTYGRINARYWKNVF